MNIAYYKVNLKEYFANGFVIAMVLLAVGMLFYDAIWVSVLFIPIGIFLFKRRIIQLRKNKAERFEMSFKDFLVSISDYMNTGYSIENAIKESYRDMAQTYGHDSKICEEIRLMVSRINLNVNVETIFLDFSNRCGLKNVKQFAQIFSVAKRTGGNMSEIIRSVTDEIVLKQSVKEEIETLIHSKKIEQRIMSVIPLVMITYIKFSSPGFLDIMYRTVMGRIVMTVCLLAYLLAFLWSERVAELEM